MNWLAIDIGGANLKIADGNGFAALRPFALWRSPETLHSAIQSLLSTGPDHDAVAVTMTGELADCYPTKRDGVARIVSAVQQATRGRKTSFYSIDGRFVASAAALENPLRVAAANWHALASYAGRFARQGCGLLFDIGSTTTDIIGLVNGKPITEGATDTERLAAGELVYTGVSRSPIAAISSSLPFRSQLCPVAQEMFATTNDVYLTLGDIAENLDDCDTPDGRSASLAAAKGRLARMVCADSDCFDENDAQQMAGAVMRSQMDMITAGLNRVICRLPDVLQTVIVSGSGEFLARRILFDRDFTANVVSLSDGCGVDVSACAAAHAVAVLVREQHP